MSIVVTLLNPVNVTAQDMIKRAMRILGVYSTGEPLSADESTDGLSVLNSMLGSWANEPLLTMYSHVLDTVILTTGLGSYTFGPSGAIVTVRPVDVLASSYISYQGISTPLAPLTLAQYSAIPNKSQSGGVPSLLLFESDYPNATVTLYPAPVAGCTLNLFSIKPLSGFTTLTGILQLPPGYEDTIVYNLAVAWAPEFEVEPSARVVKMAATTKKALKRTNTVVPVLGMPTVVLSGSSNYSQFISG